METGVSISRFSKRWVVVGAFAVFGANWIVSRLLMSLDHDSDLVGLAVLALGGAVAGLTMVAIAPLRPWREPLGAAVGAVGLAVCLLLLLARVADVPDVSPDVLHTLRSMGTVAASTVAGAMVARRWLVANPSRPWLLLLGALVTTGVLELAVELVRVVAIRGVALPALIGAVLGGGALTQCVVRVRRIWWCSFGAVASVLLSIDSWDRLEKLWPMLGIAPMIAAAGANLWCMVAKVPGDSTAVPPARAQ